jgi:hypothetical protein
MHGNAVTLGQDLAGRGLVRRDDVLGDLLHEGGWAQNPLSGDDACALAMPPSSSEGTPAHRGAV